MSNFGFFDLRLVNAYRVAVDEARSAVNAGPVLAAAREYTSLAEAVADRALVVGTTSHEAQTPNRIIRLEAAAAELAGDTAIVFGSEKHGLSNDDMSHCHWMVRIPSRPEHGSMNLGQAVAVVLYELLRRETDAVPALVHGAAQQDLQRIEDLLTEALTESGYAQSPTTAEKLRRLIRRMNLSAKDAVVWQGMLRQICWKLRSAQLTERREE